MGVLTSVNRFGRARESGIVRGLTGEVLVRWPRVSQGANYLPNI